MGEAGAIRRCASPKIAQQPLAELQFLARAMTSAKVDIHTERLVPLSTSELESLNAAEQSVNHWTESLDLPHRVDWHEREARECRLVGHREAEVFHIDQLLSVRQSPEFLDRWKNLHNGADWQPMPNPSASNEAKK